MNTHIVNTDIEITPVTAEVVLSYDLLKEFCKIRNEFTAINNSNGIISNRVKFITEKLAELGIEYKLDIFEDGYTHTSYVLKKGQTEMDYDDWFDDDGDYVYSKLNDKYEKKEIEVKNTFVNIEVEFKAEKETDESMIYLAHHDVANTHSDNCNDNSASVCNLIQFANEIKDKKLSKNIYVIFDDCEEYSGRGSNHLSAKISKGDFGKVKYVANTELSAVGKVLWIEKATIKGESQLLNKLKEVQADNNRTFYEFDVPFNDSVILRRNGIDSICIGTITYKDIIDLTEKNRHYCDTWAVCHHDSDIFDIANATDMNNFVKFLHLLY